MQSDQTNYNAPSPINAAALFFIFLRLGCISFGGPIAHLAYFRDEFVSKRRWLSERSYADIVALCQFLPGPASSQVGMSLGLLRSGYRGALLAWLGFTLPSALLMMLFAMTLTGTTTLPDGLLHGLKIVSVAVVAQAVWGMAVQYCKTIARIAIMLVCTAVLLLKPTITTQLSALVLAGMVGLLLFRTSQQSVEHEPMNIVVNHRTAITALTVFILLLAILPFVDRFDPLLRIVDIFYRSGALVFGGGHVVLPLLQSQTVATGLVSNETFLAGYGLTQAMPGPLFSFSAFLGASMHTNFPAWLNGCIALLSIYLPSALLVIGTLPFWETLRRYAWMQGALIGINAAVVGILLSALCNPIITSTIHQPFDIALALLDLVLLMYVRWPAWLVVLLSAAAGLLNLARS